MKKIIAAFVAALLCLSCFALVACNTVPATAIAIKEGSLQTTVKNNEEVDYTTLVVIVTYSDGTTKELAYNATNVKYDPIDTSTTGVKLFTVTYLGLSAQQNITVEALDVDDNIVIGFENTYGYRAYLKNIAEQSNKEEEFVKKDNGYAVGIDNGYKCVPVATVDDGNQSTINENIKTTFQLLQNGVALSDEDVAKYVSAKDNIYYFTENALDKEFTLKIILDESYETILGEGKNFITQDIRIVKGYNVHDELDLSVLDNLNNNSWADIKKAVRPWNNGKTLVQFADVECVIIHNELTVTKDNLPSNYFWQKGEMSKGGNGISYADAEKRIPENYTDLLEGSIKETYLGEEWEEGQHQNQRGLYTNNGISLIGNYLKLTYASGLSESVNQDGEKIVVAENGGIYVVCDFNMTTEQTHTYPESHTSFVATRRNTGEVVAPTIENVYFVGQTKKTDNITAPAGLMMMSTEVAESVLSNVIANQWFCNVEIDGDPSGFDTSVTMTDCKFYDSFSQMVYSWYGKQIDVVNCEFKRAGGPVFIIQSATEADNNSFGGTVFNIDSTANMESWLTGAEMWFQINNLPSSNVSQLLGLSGNLDALGKNYKQEIEGDNGQKIARRNLIAVLIPSPSKVFDNQNTLLGEINIGGETKSVQGMNEGVFNSLLSLTETAATAKTLGEQLKGAYGAMLDEQTSAALEQLIAGFGAMSANQSLYAAKVAPVFKSGNDYILFNGSAPTNLMSQDLAGNVQLLYGGVLQIVKMLQGMATQLPDEQKVVVEQTIAAWTDVANKLAPIGTVGAIDDTTWAANWAANTNGYATMYVNAGGLENPIDFSIKHFVVLFGENTAKQGA